MTSEATTATKSGLGGLAAFVMKFLMLLLGIAMGLFAGVVLLDRPEAVSQGTAFLQTQFDALVTGEFGFPVAVGWLVAVAGGVLAIYILFRSSALIGILLGLFLWVPFGPHLLNAAPDLRAIFPGAEANLEELVAERSQLARIRNWGLAIVPLPDGTDALGRMKTNEKSGTGRSRLPQITE